MSAKGTFEITLEPQEKDAAPVGRLIINKVYNGELKGKGIGQMISKRTQSGTAVYFAIEEFTGQLDDKKGTFTLMHKGMMDKNNQSLEVNIVEGSGTDELENITGSMSIKQDNGQHSYELDYQL